MKKESDNKNIYGDDWRRYSLELEKKLKECEDRAVAIEKNFQDEIAKRIKIESDFLKNERKYKEIVENIEIGIFESSEEGEVLFANPALLKILEYDSFDEISKVECKNFYLDKTDREYFKNTVLEKGRIKRYETKWVTKNGRVIDVIESGRLVIRKKKKVFEGIVEDITIQKRAQNELKIAKEKAEQSEKIKTEFLARISHEIKTPIHSIQTLLPVIEDDIKENISEELKGSFNLILDASRRIKRTIELTVGISELMTGNYTPLKKRINLTGEIIKPVLENYTSQIENKKLELKLMLGNSDSSGIRADKKLLNAAFENILDNAIKFTEKGSIEISVKESDEKLELAVKDTGIGIAEDKVEQMLEPFTQEDSGIKRKYEGNGLGLAIVKKCCEINDIQLIINSEKNKGTEVKLVFENAFV